jgi:hypothetical protein
MKNNKKRNLKQNDKNSESKISSSNIFRRLLNKIKKGLRKEKSQDDIYPLW